MIPSNAWFDLLIEKLILAAHETGYNDCQNNMPLEDSRADFLENLKDGLVSI